MELAAKFGIEATASEKNIGIGPGYAKLAVQATQPFFIFLENDFRCIEHKSVALKRLQAALNCVTNFGADAVRLRHRHNAGLPDYSLRFRGHELDEGRLHLIDSIRWIDRPDLQFPDLIRATIIDGERWFFAKAGNASFTNNPVLYRTELVQNEIVPRLNVGGFESESAIAGWWRGQPYTVAAGEGLFRHYDPWKEWRRVKRRLLGRKIIA